jgi:hypothetical protein
MMVELISIENTIRTAPIKTVVIIVMYRTVDYLKIIAASGYSYTLYILDLTIGKANVVIAVTNIKPILRSIYGPSSGPGKYKTVKNHIRDSCSGGEVNPR